MSSSSAVATIRQAMLLTAMDDAVNRFIASSGNDAAMALYQTARTNVQTKSSYSAIGASALKWCQRRRENRPRGGAKSCQLREAERHGTRARRIAGVGHGALARRAKSLSLDQVLGSAFRARLWPSR
jgi:hypothetical protein